MDDGLASFVSQYRVSQFWHDAQQIFVGRFYWQTNCSVSLFVSLFVCPTLSIVIHPLKAALNVDWVRLWFERQRQAA